MIRDAKRARALERAVELHRAGETRGALELLTWPGALEEATSQLIREREFLSAARLLIRHLRLPQKRDQLEDAVRRLGADDRGRALRVAVCVGKALGSEELGQGAIEYAAGLFVALGETARAMDLLRRAGHAPEAFAPAPTEAAPALPPGTYAFAGEGRGMTVAMRQAAGHVEAGQYGDALALYLEHRELDQAARVAEQMRKPAEAARLYSEADKPLQAARCLVRAGNDAAALEELARLDATRPEFRDGALLAVQLLDRNPAQPLGYGLESLLSELVATAPRQDDEVVVYVACARRLVAAGLVDDAKTCLRSVLRYVPAHREARLELSRLDLSDEARSGDFRRIVAEDAGFRAVSRTPAANDAVPGLPGLPDLPALPELPALPALPPVPALGSPPALAPAPHQAGRGAPPSIHYAQTLAKEPAPRVGATQASAIPSEAAAPVPVESRGELQPGTLLAQRYRIARRLGKGGMAEVFQAEDLELLEQVAIKVFRPELAGEIPLARFKQEVSVTRRLSHPNVIRLFDIGVADGLRFLTMELLQGRDLSGYTGKPLDPFLAVDWLIQIARGLQAAHAQGIVHRDVKPANVFVCEDGTLKVMDFGIAKRADNAMTQGGLSWGTPKYMSPEQIRGFSEVTPATDIYALGVIAYELFVGRPPFEHAEPVPLLMMHLKDDPPPLRERNPRLPAVVEALVLALLRKVPTERPRDCREVVALLKELQARLEAEAA